MKIELDEYEIAILITTLEKNLVTIKNKGYSPSAIRALKNILNKCNKIVKEKYPNYLPNIVNT